jgi:histidine ammonia-lyase
MKGVGDRIPPFLATKPGVESGYMMAQVTASTLVSENKTLAHPASIDSLPTSGGQEDHVSMAPWAGLKLLQIQENVRQILAIELLVASAACTLFHDGLRPGKGTAPILEHIQRMVPFHKGDRVLSGEINTLSDLIGTGKVVSLVNEVVDLE